MADQRITVELIGSMTRFLQVKDVRQESDNDSLLFAGGRDL